MFIIHTLEALTPPPTPSLCVLLMDQTCLCSVVDTSTYWNFPWLIIIYSHGCLPPPSSHQLPIPNATKRENKSNNSVSHYSQCLSTYGSNQHCVSVCDTMWMFLFSIHLLFRYKALCPRSFLHLFGSSFLSRPLHLLSPSLSPCPRLWCF